jgi:hypothetical protein
MVRDQVSRDDEMLFQRVMVHIFRDTFCNMWDGVIGMDDHFSMTAYIPKSSNLRKNII